ncbi:hypothetical protein PCASD_05820 [Puccinia coronata f. sp. avenae]|uniref:Uncharacterized protein n=1 Tax=Puccinia coronata f. sp. avenae TaxID=200324 RepID=A0A2N5V1L6_9BASI|nr:hypothetical protein PCASD_05820 [Puccinia coronata f. sp. avenae]
MPSIRRSRSLPHMFNNYRIIYPLDPGISQQDQTPRNTNQSPIKGSSNSEEENSVSKPLMDQQTPTIPRPVKIEPMDEGLFFDGSNIPVKTFIRRYEDAGEMDGASAKDLFEQILFFIRGSKLRNQVQEMKKHANLDWEILKNQLAIKFRRYTMDDLDNFLRPFLEYKVTCSTLQEFEIFRSHFEAMVCYLVQSGSTCYPYSFFDQFLLEVLSSEVQSEVLRKLLKDGQAYWIEDEHLVIPPYEIILHYIYTEYMSEKIPVRPKEEPKITQEDQHHSQEISVNKHCPKTYSLGETQARKETPALISDPSLGIPEEISQTESMYQNQKVTKGNRIIQPEDKSPEHSPTLPENLARMAASKFILDAAIRFKLGRAPLSESLTDSNSVAKRPGR